MNRASCKVPILLVRF